GQHAEPATARRLVPLEGEVHLVDAMALRGRAERRLGAPRPAAEENAVLAPHVVILPGDFSRIGRPGSNGVSGRWSRAPRPRAEAASGCPRGVLWVYARLRSTFPACGAVAQLGERLNGIQEVEGSTPFGSTLPFRALGARSTQLRLPCCIEAAQE